MATKRDAHFEGFANLLYRELSELEGSHETLISEYRNKYDKQAIVRLIAQRAYDLVAHVIENTSLDSLGYLHFIYRSGDFEPDLAAWPTTEPSPAAPTPEPPAQSDVPANPPVSDNP